MEFFKIITWVILLKTFLSLNISNFLLESDKNKENDEYAGLKKKAELVTEEIRFKLSNLHKDLKLKNITSWCIVAAPKSRSSFYRKLALKTNNTNSNKNTTDNKIKKELILTDIARASFVVASYNDMEYTKRYLIKTFGTPVKIKDNFKNPKSSGYRDINIVFLSSTVNKIYINNRKSWRTEIIKMNFEIQIHICNIIQVKEIEHTIYEVIRIVDNINSKKKFDEILKETFIGIKGWDKLIEHFLAYGNVIDEKNFKIVINQFNIWKNDKNNESNAKEFVRLTRNFSKRLYNVAYEDFISNKTICNITSVNNDTCTLNFKGFIEEGLNYWHSILNNETVKAFNGFNALNVN